MAAPGSGIKFLGLDSALVDLAEKKSTLSNNKQEYFTASDIANGITAFDNGIVINETGADSDTRIEGQSDANLFFVDASTDRVGIGTNTPSFKLDVISPSTLTSRFINDTNGDVSGLRVQGSTTAGSDSFFDAYIDPDAGEYGFTRFMSLGGDSPVYGGNQVMLSFSSLEATFNQYAKNFDVRIEGQTDANLFFVDASTDRVGIGTNTPALKLHNYAASGSNWTYTETAAASDSGYRMKNSVKQWGTYVGGTGQFIVRDFSGSINRFVIDTNGSQVLGSTAALATTATDGFTYIPTCAGTPTGTPTAYTGKVPMVYDTTNSIMYVYTGGAWTAV